jgi:hypothetical protein
MASLTQRRFASAAASVSGSRDEARAGGVDFEQCAEAVVFEFEELPIGMSKARRVTTSGVILGKVLIVLAIDACRRL